MSTAKSKASALLREHAEERLNERYPDGLVPQTGLEAFRLAHELMVHQIELEMQNETLQQARMETEALVNKYTELYDYAPVGYLTLNTEGLIIEANLTASMHLKQDRFELLQKRMGIFLEETSRPVFNEFLDLVFKNEHPQTCEVLLADPEINNRALELQGQKSDDGTLCNLTFLDITAKRLAHQAEQRLAAAIEQSSESVLITDTDGNITYTNKAFEEASGYTHAEVIGKNPNILKSGKQSPEFYQTLWSDLIDKGEWRGCLINRHKDGHLYTEDAGISAVKDEAGNVIHYVAVKRDITDQLEIEKELNQSRKLEAVGRLAGGVAHDFNNLLAGIIGYVELCQEEIPDSHPSQEWLAEIINEAQHSAAMTAQLLSFTSNQPIQPKVVNLNNTIDDTVKLLGRLIGETMEIIWQPGEDLNHIKIDPSQAAQLLMNLCINARDASDHKGPIKLQTGNLTTDKPLHGIQEEIPPGDYVFLSVTDEGCGMDEETQTHIFEPFFTTKPVGKGTGLGLSTVFGIIQQYQGGIQVESEPGQGSTFTLYFPKTVESAPKSTQKKIIHPQGKGETILLVEDNPSIRTVLTKSLTSLGYEVTAADSPATAIDVAKEHAKPFDLLFTDINMPKMSGMELNQALKALGLIQKTLFMSGFTDDVLSPIKDSNPDIPFIKKPFERHEMACKLRHILEIKS